jgi:flagellar M-ring protein FliF
MDLLNRAYAQLHEQFRSMTPGSRLMAGLLAVVVLLSLGCLFTHQATSPDADLMHGVATSAGQTQKMIAALAEANLNGYEVRGASIYVPHGQEAVYMGALAKAKALPPDFGAAQREAANGGSWTEIGSQRERDRMRIAKQDDLALEICKRPGIESASVHLDMDKPSGFQEKVLTALASVKPAGAGQLDKAQVLAIRHLVAGAIAGLKPENVTVADLNGPTWCGNPEDTYELDLKAKILNALAFIPNVTVALSVELDREQIRSRQSKLALDAAGNRSNNAAAGHLYNNGAQAGQTPPSDQRSNVATVIDALLGGSPGKEPTTEPNASTGSRVQVEKETIAAPISARVSVGVPASYYRKVWQNRNPSQSGEAPRIPEQSALDQICAEATTTIQKLVVPLLPRTDGPTNATDLVTVTTLSDIEIATQERPAPDFQQAALKWLAQSWSTLSMIGLALISLFVLRSMVRSDPATVTRPTKAVSAAVDNDATDVKRAEARRAHRPKRFDAASPSFREELSAIVEDDPETAANVLRSWIGQGV